MSVTVGIDLGTTYSLVAVLRDGAPVVLANRDEELLTPSAVGLAADGRMVVGALAQAQTTLRPEHTATAFKRDMGTNRTWELGDKSFTAPQLSGMVLAALKADAEAELGEPLEAAVVTVPAYFGERQRQATRDAASSQPAGGGTATR